MHQFEKKIAENRAAGMDRTESVRQARADDPDGYESWINEHNATYQPSDPAREAFARRTA